MEASIAGIKLMDIRPIPATIEDGYAATILYKIKEEDLPRLKNNRLRLGDDDKIGTYMYPGDFNTPVLRCDIDNLKHRIKQYYEYHPMFDVDFVYMHTPEEVEEMIEDDELPISHDYDEDVQAFLDRVYSLNKRKRKFELAINSGKRAYINVSFPYKTANTYIPKEYGVATMGTDAELEKVYIEAKKKLVTAVVDVYTDINQFVIV